MSQMASFVLKPATRQTLADSITESLRDAIYRAIARLTARSEP